jgi:hypothetical protein
VRNNKKRTGVWWARLLPYIHNQYIDDIRRDVLAMSELAEELVGELAEHPIAVPPTYAFSPASIGKGYLRSTLRSPIILDERWFALCRLFPTMQVDR